LPYELNVYASASASNRTVTLTFFNTGRATAVFHVRSGNIADAPRFYTVEPGKQLTDTWSETSTYDLSVYGPNGFMRYFKGSLGSGAAALDIARVMRAKGAARSSGELPMSAPPRLKLACSTPMQATRERSFSIPAGGLKRDCA
jgi:hypothetical protein